jgi:hypothetical protein
MKTFILAALLALGAASGIASPALAGEGGTVIVDAGR